MRMLTLIAALAGTAVLAGAPEENTKFPLERHAAIAALIAAD